MVENDLEKRMYRSCLRQVVAALNKTLPVISDSTEKEQEIKKPKTEKTKKMPSEDVIDSYLIKDVTPKRLKTDPKYDRKLPVEKEKKKSKGKRNYGKSVTKKTFKK